MKKHMLSILAVIIMIAVGCQNNQEQDSSKNSDKEKTEKNEKAEKSDKEKTSSCTETVESCDGTITTDSILNNFENFKDQKVSICGKVTHSCMHGNKRLFLAGNEVDDVVVVTNEEKFPEDIVGKKVIIKGKIKMIEAEEEHEEHEEDDDHIDDKQHTDAHNNKFVVETSKCIVCKCDH